MRPALALKRQLAARYRRRMRNSTAALALPPSDVDVIGDGDDAFMLPAWTERNKHRRRSMIERAVTLRGQR